MSRRPIIFDFTKGQAYRAAETSRAKDLVETLRAAAKDVRKPRVVRTVEGIPPQVLTQPKK
jgi:hypothetical protein